MVKADGYIAAVAAVLRLYADHADSFLPRAEVVEMFSATLTADEVDEVIDAGVARGVFVEEPRGLRLGARSP